jgi:DNA invertase Pin-like site-specific DNA recombinase
MTTNQLVPAAQYLRMSTEHQQYSLENQSAAIQRYAETQGFEVVLTYRDTAKSGLVLRHRVGLRQLLQDVVSGTATYRAILVYDVSRWGRFQDTDESAHYEFLCKSAGVPVHYCAETFANDGSLPSLVMKALKRTMAAEYSRELGIRVFEGQKRLARLGFKQGGAPGYGLRRMLVSPDRLPKQLLADGEQKSIATDRVILVPGPAHEVQVVREIYRMLVSEKRSVHAIARELNRRGVAYIGGSKWHPKTVGIILTHPKYAGCHVFNRTSYKLFTPSVRLPKSEWILKPNAFESVVDETTFAEAQKVLANRTINKSDADVLDDLRALLASEGKLSIALIQNSPDVPSPASYARRFGTMQHAYELIGYGRSAQFGPLDVGHRTRALRRELVAQIVGMFPDDISIVSRNGRWRSLLRLHKGLMISLIIARCVRPWKDAVRWRIDAIRYESQLVTLLARLDECNRSFLDFHILPDIDRRSTFRVSLKDSWLERGKRLSDLSQFCEVAAMVWETKKSAPPCGL